MSKSLALLFVFAVSAGAVGQVTVKDQSGATRTSSPISIFRTFKQGDIPHYAQAIVSGGAVTTQCDVKTRWPDGSLKQAMVSFHASISANSAIAVNFQDQATGNNSGYLSQADLLARSWDARIGTVASSISKSADARTILTAASSISTGPDSLGVRYWLRGPIVTQVIIEDRSASRVNDFGYTCTASCTTTYSSATWSSDTTNRSLHPIFVLTFYTNYTSGVKVDYILENDWTTALQDQRYTVTLSGDSGNVTTKYTATMTHYARTRWRQTYWSGTALGDLKVDHGLAYLISTGLVPNYDTSLSVSSTSVSSDITSWNATDKCNQVGNGSGYLLKAMPTTGQTTAPYIGLIPRWQARWLFVMNNAAIDNTYFNGPLLLTAQCSANIPFHLRESATGRWFDSGHTVDAVGHPISIDARPTIYYTGSDGGSDRITNVATLSSSHGWTMDIAHEPGLAYLPYLLTGDWFILEELYFLNSYHNVAPNPGSNCQWCKHGDWAYMNDGGIQPRGVAWATRTNLEAAVSAPDGSPEKAHYTQKVNFNIEVNEGRYGITDGAFPPSSTSCAGFSPTGTTDKWLWGRCYASQQQWDDGVVRLSPLGILTPGNNALCDSAEVQNFVSTSSCNTGWHDYFLYAAWGHASDLGFPMDKLLAYGAKPFLNMVLNTDYNPFLIQVYKWVTMDASKNYLTSWGAASSAGMKYYALNNARSTWATTVGPSDYPNMAKAAATWAYPYTDGSYTGVAAWAWYALNVPNTGSGEDPKWALLPRIGGGGSPPVTRSVSFRGRSTAVGRTIIH